MPSWVIPESFSPFRAELQQFAARVQLVVDETDLERRSERCYDTADFRILRGELLLLERVVGSTREISLESLTGARLASATPAHANDSPAAEFWWNVDGEFAETLRALIGSHELKSWVEIDESGAELKLRSGAVVEATLRLVVAETRSPLGSQRAVLRTVEVKEGEGEIARRAHDLPTQLGLAPVAVSQWETALDALDVRPPPPRNFGDLSIDPNGSLGALAFASLRLNAERCLRHEAGTRLGIDGEELHDMRVAIRRMRSALRLFAAALPRRARQLAAELGWLGRALGAVRDFDVQLAELKSWEATLDEDERSALALLQVDLELERRRARRRLLRALNSARYERVMTRLEKFLRTGPPLRNSEAQRAARSAAPGQIARCERRARKLGRRLEPTSPAAEWHELRKRARSFRYALEFFAPLYSKSLTQLVTSLVALQDLLGAHQDAEVAEARLRAWIARPKRRRPAATAFVIGRLCERTSRTVARERAKFAATFARVTGKRWKKLQKEMTARLLAPPRGPSPRVSKRRTEFLGQR